MWVVDPRHYCCTIVKVHESLSLLACMRGSRAGGRSRAGGAASRAGGAGSVVTIGTVVIN